MSDRAGSEWITARIGELLTHRKEHARPADPLLSVTSGRGVVPQTESGRRDISSPNKWAYWRVYPGDIVYNTMRMWQGVSARSDHFGIVSPAYTVCSPRADTDVDTRFLSQVFKLPAYIAMFKNRSQGLVSDTWNLKYRSFGDISITFPGPAEQRRISEILDEADEAIRSTERLIVKLEQARQGLHHDLFTRGIEQSGHLRYPHRAGQFASSPIGLIPKDWEVKRLTEMGRVRSGATPSRSMSSRYFSRDGLPWVKTLDLNEGYIYDTDERISATAMRECSCPSLSPGSVLLAMYGGWSQIGRTGLLAVPASINQAISSVELFDSTILPEYLLIALQYGRERWKSIGASTRKDPNITRQDVLTFEVPVPSVPEQKRIIAVDAQSKARIASEHGNLSKLRLLKQGLMDDLLTGRVRVGASA